MEMLLFRPSSKRKNRPCGSACWRRGSKKSSSERIARRRRITTTEKEAVSTRSSWHPRRERIRSKRKAEGYEGSGGRFVPVAALHRDIAYLTVEGGVRRGERIRDVTEADGADCQPGKVLGTKNSDPRAAGLQRQSQGLAVHARYDRSFLGNSG